jgi:cobalamin biosynthetic protein CobC
LGKACFDDVEGHRVQRARTAKASERLVELLTRHGFAPQGGCALFQWLVTPLAVELHEFCAQRGILLRIFLNNSPAHSSLRFGLPRDEADWQRLERALSEFSGERA